MTTKVTSAVLTNTSVTPGTYGGGSGASTQIPVLTVDAQGRITYSSNVAIALASSATTDTTNASNITSGTLSLARLSTIPLTQGGTGATSAGSALTNLLPTGTTAGYVLTTGGPGTFYWAAIGAQQTLPGTTINSTRLSYSATAGQTAFTTPTYVPGASQLRVYINGIRQFNSAYTETSNTVVTLNEGCILGDAVMVEVDGYINNPYYANNITFTAPQGSIPSSANTIQLAIQDLESRKAALAGSTFTGDVQGITMATSASNTSFATTSYVKNNLANYTPTSSLAASATTDTTNASNITSGSLPNARLANNSITINGTSVSLGGSTTITNSVGYNQTWQQPSRTHLTVYQNTTGKPIQLLVAGDGNDNQNGQNGVYVSTDNSNWLQVGHFVYYGRISIIIPPNYYYYVAVGSVWYWSELR